MRLLFLALLMAGCNQSASHYNDVLREDWKQTRNEVEIFNYNDGDIGLLEVPVAPAYPVLIGGAPADRKDWPASFTSSQGGSRCTGTVLGPRALQIAAHCVGNGKIASITKDNIKYMGPCTHHQNYKNDSTADYALCLLDKPIDLPWYEGVVKDGSEIKVGSMLLLAGMGGTQPGGSGGNDDVFRIGEAPVIRLPTSNNDIVTKGKSALAFGDSGGSAFFKGSDGVYKVVAVNSRGDIQTTSYLSSVFTKSARDFYIKWITDNNAQICGISDSAPKCRGAGGEPNPTPVPPWCSEVLATVNKCIYGNPRLSLTEPQKCRDEYAKLFACQVASEGDGQ
jgi:hypothetical protein